MKDERGFSLFEVLVALSILTMASAAVFSTMLGNLRVTRESYYTTQAIQAAQETLDNLRRMDPAQLPTSGKQDSAVEIGGRVFDIETSFCAQGSFCGTNTRHLRVAVFYEDLLRFEVETVYTKLR